MHTAGGGKAESKMKVLVCAVLGVLAVGAVYVGVVSIHEVLEASSFSPGEFMARYGKYLHILCGPPCNVGRNAYIAVNTAIGLAAAAVLALLAWKLYRQCR